MGGGVDLAHFITLFIRELRREGGAGAGDLAHFITLFIRDHECIILGEGGVSGRRKRVGGGLYSGGNTI